MALLPVLVLTLRGVGWAAPAPEIPGLAEIRSERFVVRFDPERDWILGAPALEALEAGRGAIASWLGDPAPLQVRVEIAPTLEEFERAAELDRREIESGGAVAAVVGGRIVLLSPRLLLRGYPWRDALNNGYARWLLVRLGAGRAPPWLEAGVARCLERRWRAPGAELLDAVDRSLVARAMREGGLPPLASLEAALAQPPSAAAARLALAVSALAAEHLVAAGGGEGLRRLLAEVARLPEGSGFEGALRTVAGVSPDDFEEGLRRSLGARGYAEVPGLSVPPHHFAGRRGESEALDLADWQPLAAQNHLRLGDMLRARGNLRAALIEYERARAAAPASPYAGVRVSRALRELGRGAEAAAAAREAQRVGPGYPAASLALAAALAAAGDGEGTAAALREALEINPFDPFAWRDLGRALRRLGRAQEAQQASVNALRLRPGDQEFMQSVMRD